MSEYLDSGPCSDTCILDGWDGEPADFCRTETRKARKSHRCCECRKTIQPGQRYEVCSGSWDGGIQTFKTCQSCVEIRAKFSCGGAFIFKALWNTLREELYQRLTFGCLDGLSPQAKDKVIADWREWKGLSHA